MEIEIEDDELVGFNDLAKEKLKESTSEFVSKLIEESHRLESNSNTSGGTPEVTSSNVSDANILVSKGLSKKKKGIGSKILRIFAALLPLVVGAMYNSTKLQDSAYMLVFVCVVALAIITVTVSILVE
ncbi:hypothetical protein [Pseudoalteromonas pernae]|uniref:hypothetical protein n=1 Tax=Pseudoalteromonas pernae TaxID=3118054 RepID=UPI00324208FE